MKTTFNIPSVNLDKVNNSILKLLNKYKTVDKAKVSFGKPIVLLDKLNHSIQYTPITVDDTTTSSSAAEEFLKKVKFLLEDNVAEPDDVFSNFGIGACMIPVREFIANSIIKIKEDGYISASKAYEEKTEATGDYVYNNFSMLENPDQEYLDLADKVIAWVNAKEDTSEFFSQVKDIVRGGFVNKNNKNYAASIYVGYSKDSKPAAIVSTGFYGNVGDNFDIILKLVSKTVSNTVYGELNILDFVTDEGCILSWVTGNDSDAVVDNYYYVRGKIKKHVEYKGQKKTTINYCKVYAAE